MLRFETSARIETLPEEAWATLIQTARWPEWGAGIERVDGALGPDERLTLHVAGQSRPFELAVRQWHPTEHIELVGGLPIGLFTGTRTYRLEADGDGTRFRMTERFTGLLAPLITRGIPDLQPSFDAFAAGLKSAAEADHATSGS